MRGQTDFVKVRRIFHNDVMSIVKWVAEKYPNEYEIIEEDKPIVKSKATKRVTKKTLGGTGVQRKVEEEDKEK